MEREKGNAKYEWEGNGAGFCKGGLTRPIVVIAPTSCEICNILIDGNEYDLVSGNLYAIGCLKSALFNYKPHVIEAINL